MKYDVFISYSSHDQKVVEGLCAYLEQHKIRCFVAYRDIPKCKPWPPYITEGLAESRMMVVVFSNNFNLSEEVDRELTIASKKKMPILTFRLSDDKFIGTKEYYLSNINWIDAFPNPDNAFGRVTEDIAKLLNINVESAQEEEFDTEEHIVIPQPKPKSNKRWIYAILGLLIIFGGVWYFSEKQKVLIPKCDGFKGERYGFVDARGVTVIPFVYEEADLFSGGLAKVKKDGKYGYIDETGKVVIPFVYDGGSYFQKGLAHVRKDGKQGVIDKNGNEVTPCIYDIVDYFFEGLACVEKDGKWGFIDKNGNEVIHRIYDYVGSFSEGLASVKKDGKCGFIDKRGKVVIPLIYDDMFIFSEGLAAVCKKDGGWRFINKKGKVVIPTIYDNAGVFSEGLATVKIDGKWGFIDKKGKVVIALIYDFVFGFKEGRARVEKDGKWFSINKKGETVCSE